MEIKNSTNLLKSRLDASKEWTKKAVQTCKETEKTSVVRGTKEKKEDIRKDSMYLTNTLAFERIERIKEVIFEEIMADFSDPMKGMHLQA